MESRVKLFGHPVHQQLVALPLGMLAFGVLFDAIGLFGGLHVAGEVAFWAIGTGIVTGIVAAGFGMIDLAAIPERTRASRIGMLHGVGNVVVLSLFIGSWALRQANGHEPTSFALVLAFTGAALALVTGWLGGELVSRLGVGVSSGAHLDAGSSLDSSLDITAGRIPQVAPRTPVEPMALGEREARRPL